MSTVSLRPAASLPDRLRIRRLYRRAFPASERKPFSIIRRMEKNGTTDVWMIFSQKTFAGFATTINSPELVMLDYLAIEPGMRGCGVGTEALARLLALYEGRGFFVEIENPFPPGHDREDRLRRRAFYRRCGLSPLQVMARVFGVEMELLGKDCTLDFEAYQHFYRTRYNEYAAERLEKLPHPEAAEQQSRSINMGVCPVKG